MALDATVVVVTVLGCVFFLVVVIVAFVKATKRFAAQLRQHQSSVWAANMSPVQQVGSPGYLDTKHLQMQPPPMAQPPVTRGAVADKRWGANPAVRDDDDLVDVIISHQHEDTGTHLADERKFYSNPLFKQEGGAADVYAMPPSAQSIVRLLPAANGKVYPHSAVAAGAVSNRQWEAAELGYVPTTYTTDEVTALSASGKADPGLSSVLKRGAVLWNSIDTKSRPPIDRRSYTGERYEVVQGLPQCPLGRTGFAGRGALKLWGPNHRACCVVAKASYDGAPLVLGRLVDGAIELPTADVPAGADEYVAMLGAMARTILPPQVGDTATDGPASLLGVLQSLLEPSGVLVHRGCVDHERNTDNAWVEQHIAMFPLDESAAAAFDDLLESNGAALSWFKLSSNNPFTVHIEKHRGSIVTSAVTLVPTMANVETVTTPVKMEEPMLEQPEPHRDKTSEMFGEHTEIFSDVETSNEASDVEAISRDRPKSYRKKKGMSGIEVIEEEDAAEVPAVDHGTAAVLAPPPAAQKEKDPRLPKDGEVIVDIARYCGSCATDVAGGTEVIQHGYTMVGMERPQVVRLVIGAEGIEIQEPPTGEELNVESDKLPDCVQTEATMNIVDAAVHTISYTGQHSAHDKVFGFVANDRDGIMVVHIFESNRAKALCDAVKKSFSVAQEIKLDPFAVNRFMPPTPNALGMEAAFQEKNLIFDRKKLQSKRIIGHGQYGKVYLAEVANGKGKRKSKKEESLAAVKLMRPNLGHVDGNDFLTEGLMMANFNHENLLGLLGVCIEKRPWVLITEYLHYKDCAVVFKYLNKNGVLLRLHEMLTVCTQVANGMRHMADNHYVHRDLAARNIMLSHRNEVKIGDFGLARKIPDGQTFWKLDKAGRLPVKYMSIEALTLKRFSQASDVWAFAVCVWEIMTYAQVPWVAEGVANTEVKAAVKAGKRLFKPDMRLVNDGDDQDRRNSALWDEWWAEIKECWAKEVTDRPTFEDLHASLSRRLEAASVKVPPARDIGNCCYQGLEDAKKRKSKKNSKDSKERSGSFIRPVRPPK